MPGIFFFSAKPYLTVICPLKRVKMVLMVQGQEIQVFFLHLCQDCWIALIRVGADGLKIKLESDLNFTHQIDGRPSASHFIKEEHTNHDHSPARKKNMKMHSVIIHIQGTVFAASAACSTCAAPAGCATSAAKAAPAAPAASATPAALLSG